MDIKNLVILAMVAIIGAVVVKPVVARVVNAVF